MSSLTVCGLITLVAGVVWKLMQNRPTAPSSAKPTFKAKNEAAATSRPINVPTRSEAFAAWLKIEQAMRAQQAPPEQIRAAGLACLTPLVMEQTNDEK